MLKSNALFTDLVSIIMWVPSRDAAGQHAVRHGSYMSALADRIGNHPVLLSLLDRVDPQGEQFGAAQSAANQHGDHCVISQFTDRRRRAVIEEPPALLSGQPVSETNTDPPCTRDPADTGRQFWTHEAGGRPVSDAPDRR